MKKICFLVDSIFSIGGVQRVTAVIAKALASDYDVTIVTFDKPSDKNTSLYNLKEADIHYRFFQFPQSNHLKWKCSKIYSGLYRKVLPQTNLTSKWYSHSSFLSEKREALIKELKSGNYEVIVGVHASLAVRLAACKSQLGNIKLIGWIHNSYQALFSENTPYCIGPELIKYYKYQLKKLDHTIVLCQYDAKKYHLPTDVIYNPLTLIPGDVSQGTSKKFLAVGRFSRKHKGFDLLIQAFHLFATEYGLENRITIHPFTNYIQSYYSNAQVYVLSSRWEGFGLVLVEAMAHGLPIVSSNLPTSQEIMGDFGLYFENGNVEELAQRLEEATHLNWERLGEEI